MARKSTVDAQGVRHVDITPTWRGVAPILAMAFEHGNDTARAAARLELLRMADLADAYVASQKGA